MEQKTDLLVKGYIREHIQLPLDIILLCIKWYHNPLYIALYDEDRARVTNTDKTIIRCNGSTNSFNTFYGSTIMPSMNNNTVYEYEIKIKRDKLAVVIGMIDAKHNDTKCTFYNITDKAKCYALLSWFGTLKYHYVTIRWELSYFLALTNCASTCPKAIFHFLVLNFHIR